VNGVVRATGSPTKALRAGSILAVMLLWCVWPAAARQVPDARTLNGRLQDSEGRPLADWPIAFHRVDSVGGAQLASGTTDGAGRFAFPLELEGEGLFFGVARYEGQLYVGTPFRAADAPVGEYVIVVGPGGTAVPAGAAGSGADLGPGRMGPPPESLPLTGIGLILLVAGLFVAAVRGGGGANWRGLLVELAELEEGFAAAANRASGEEREQYRRRRAEVWDRLRAAARVDS
jgi:hypothetical protein